MRELLRRAYLGLAVRPLARLGWRRVAGAWDRAQAKAREKGLTV